MVPNGYITIPEAVRKCNGQASWDRSIESCETSLFGGKNSEKPANLILEQALVTGEVTAALIRRADGVMVVMPAASWRRRHRDPRAFFDEKFIADPPTRPFGFAELGYDIPVKADAEGNLSDWGTAVIAEMDLAIWFGANSLPQAPFERPADWPTKPERPQKDATEAELRTFLIGFAIGSIERGILQHAMTIVESPALNITPQMQ